MRLKDYQTVPGVHKSSQNFPSNLPSEAAKLQVNRYFLLPTKNVQRATSHMQQNNLANYFTRRQALSDELHGLLSDINSENAYNVTMLCPSDAVRGNIVAYQTGYKLPRAWVTLRTLISQQN